MSTAHGGVFKSRLERVHFLTVGASILLLLTVFSVIVLGSVGAAASLLQDPSYYIAQQSTFRFLQFLYCFFIIYILKTPPEIQSRALYSEILE